MSLAAQRGIGWWWCLLEATEPAWLTVHGARACCLLREWAPGVNIEQLLRACAAIGLARDWRGERGSVPVRQRDPGSVSENPPAAL